MCNRKRSWCRGKLAWGAVQQHPMRATCTSAQLDRVDEQFGFLLLGGGVEWRLWRSGVSIGLDLLLGFGGPRSRLTNESGVEIVFIGGLDVGYRFSL